MVQKSIAIQIFKKPYLLYICLYEKGSHQHNNIQGFLNKAIIYYPIHMAFNEHLQATYVHIHYMLSQ